MLTTRGVVSLTAVLAIALLPACSDGGNGSSETASNEMSLTMRDDGCTYEGDDTPTEPTFTVSTDNQSSRFVSYGVARIPEQYVDVERERIEDGNAFLLSPPSYYSAIDGGGTGSGITGSFLVENATPGAYALWCAGEQSSAIYVVALLDVVE